MATDQAQTGECELAYSNPKCPYVTVINLNSNTLKNTEKALIALLGEDGTGLNSGVIHDILHEIRKLHECQKVQKSWVENWKPLIYVAGSAAVTFVITWAVTGHF